MHLLKHQPVTDGRQRAVIEAVEPEIDGGRFRAKRIAGDLVQVEADVFTDGHDAVSAEVIYRHASHAEWSSVPMRSTGNDHWRAEFEVAELGVYQFTVRGWVDPFQTWQRDLKKRILSHTDTPLDYQIGAGILEEAIARASDMDAALLRRAALSIRNEDADRKTALDPNLAVLMTLYADPALKSSYGRTLEITVDPPKARFSSWYEFFPRSASGDTSRHGTFADCEKMLPYVAGMGFDVLYLPPIHPIGTTFRKGKNNAVKAEPDDVGSPWAIGAAEGGHKSVHPDLGTRDEFKGLVDRARSLGIDIAMDIAFQAAPDHPYVREHPEWFRRRPDGTIQYAENPPKKYQDIYPFDFESSGWESMWLELKSVFTFWIELGVNIFRVDNPHTKAFPFWEWAIREIKSEHPQVLFLSEAFTRPKVMYRLAKVGFSQSYTYFPWRHTKHEITTYLTELTQTKVREYFRPNHWPNTPDILTEFLQTTGRIGHMMRLILAATLGANYGIYGPVYELAEAEPRHAGSEEYLDSEKYQLRAWNLNRPDSLRDFITLINRVRRENAALHNDWSLRFHPVDNEALIAYSKQSSDGSNLVVVVVNLDPQHRHSGYITLPLEDLHIESGVTFQAHELLTGARYLWNGERNYIEIDPRSVPAQIYRLRRRLRTEREFEYFL